MWHRLAIETVEQGIQCLFSRVVKGLAYRGKRHTCHLGFAQIIETGDRYIVWHANAALLKRLQRAERHAVIRRNDRLKTEFAFIE